MNNLIEKRDAEVKEFERVQGLLKEKQEAISALQQEAIAMNSFLIEKKGRIEVLSELIENEPKSEG